MFWKAKSDQKRLENIFALISERDVTSYELAIVELNDEYHVSQMKILNWKQQIKE